MRIDLKQYLAGRDELYPHEYTPEIKANAEKTVEKVNALLAVLEAQGVSLEANPRTLSIVNSGWRPPQINGQIANAAPKSRHLTAQACDLYDPEGLIDAHLITDAGQRELSVLGLWMENPAATKAWCHVQIVPPRSGKRVFMP